MVVLFCFVAAFYQQFDSDSFGLKKVNYLQTFVLSMAE
jgi:hypothetical protein